MSVLLMSSGNNFVPLYVLLYDITL